MTYRPEPLQEALPTRGAALCRWLEVHIYYSRRTKTSLKTAPMRVDDGRNRCAETPAPDSAVMIRELPIHKLGSGFYQVSHGLERKFYLRSEGPRLILVHPLRTSGRNHWLYMGGTSERGGSPEFGRCFAPAPTPLSTNAACQLEKTEQACPRTFNSEPSAGEHAGFSR